MFEEEDPDVVQSTVLLTALSTLDQAQIIRIEEAEAAQLSSFGIYPGVVIQVRQRFPSYIIQTAELEIALESGVACKIWVKKLPDGRDSGPLPYRRRRRFRRCG